MFICAALSLPLTAVAKDRSFLRPNQSSVKTTHKKVMIDENTIIFRGEVTTDLVAKTMDKMYKSEQDKIVIFIDSPGGSVVDGLYLFNFIANFHKPTICYVNFAASMAFAITQACTERYVADTTIMMQHQASFGGQGTMGKMTEMSRFGGTLAYKANEMQAKRIGMSAEDLDKRTMNEWWMLGEEAVAENVADKVVFMECKPELTKKTVKETIKVFIFTVEVTWSGCPLINAPIGVSMGGDAPAGAVTKVQELLNDKMKYVKELKER